MMSIWKLRVGAESYYLSRVANGLEDYYTHRGEASGRWLGAAALGLGLEPGGQVEGNDLRAVLAGLQPGTGESPNGGPPVAFKRRVPGFDLTFAAPKSVSVLYGLGDPLIQAAVIEAHDRAVDEAVAWLEREACHVRRGSNNRAAATGGSAEFGTRRLPGAGFAAAAFRHRTSRSADPHLHTHVLVPNLTRGLDGRWSALDATGLYRSKHAVGAVYRTALARDLSARLGVRWRPAGNGLIEIAGVPREVLRVFSKRREEIEAHLAATGSSGAAAAADAMLATRPTHQEDLDPQTLRRRWQDEAKAVGFGQRDVDRLLDGHPRQAGQVVAYCPDPDTGEIIEQILNGHRLADQVAERMIALDSTCTRHQITQIVAEVLPGLGVSGLERLTAAVLAHPELVPLPAPAPPVGEVTAGWEQRWTSRRLLAMEQDILRALDDPRDVQPPIPGGLIEAVIAGSTLGPDQAHAVRVLCGSQRQVSVLVGRAGTGKTFALASVRHILRDHAQRRVVGVAPSARAARELGDGAGIPAYTFPAYEWHVGGKLTAEHVLIVDEAGMAGTADLHQLIARACRVGARVILVGDHHQLPEISAGGVLSAAVGHPGTPVAELTVNHRQRSEWQRSALDELRHGNALAGFRTYAEHGCVTVAPTTAEVHTAVVDDWVAAHHAGSDAILLAGTRTEVTALNRLARQRIAGELSGRTLTAGGRDFQRGDRVVLLRNAHPLEGNRDLDRDTTCRLDNGMIGTIQRVGRNGSIDVTLINGRRLRLTADYVAGGDVDHGYATTIHKAQGLTCDWVFLVGPSGLYREAVYVALSRARSGAHIYATRAQVAELVERPHTDGIPLPDEHDGELDHDLRQAVAASRAKHLALAHDRLLPHIDHTAEMPLDELWQRHVEVRHAAATVASNGVEDPRIREYRLTAAREHRRYLAPGVRVNAADWDNFGIVIAVTDNSGLVHVEFTSSDGQRKTRRSFEWADTRPVDRPEPTALTPDADAYFALAEQALVEAQHDWRHALAQHGVHPDELHIVPAAIAVRRRRLGHQLAADQPDWLTGWLGARPADATGAQVWDDEIAQLAAWRDARHLPPHVPGYGPQPTDPHLHERWMQHLDRSLTVRCWLQDHHPTLPSPAPHHVDIRAVRERLAELDMLLASAPPDQTHIIDALRSGELRPADLHAALAAAADTQHLRRQWILEHWPHVVEHAELSTISDQYDALAHWPTPISPDTQALLDQLLATSVDTPEATTIVELDAKLADHHPEQVQRRLETEAAHLVEQRDLLRQAARRALDPAQVGQFEQHIERLTHRINAARAEIDRHGTRIALWSMHQHPDHLQAAVARRANHLAHTALNDRAPWLITTLERWQHHHPGGEIGDLHQLLTDIAVYRERSGHFGDDPLGPSSGDPDHADLKARLEPEASISIHDLLADR